MATTRTTMSTQDREWVVSYLTLRQMIGWIGLLMPIAVRVGGYLMERIHTTDSISAYYYTSMRDVFVSTLVLVGILLGVAIGSSKLVYDAVYPLLVGFYSIPKVAVVPIFVVWFGRLVDDQYLPELTTEKKVVGRQGPTSDGSLIDCNSLMLGSRQSL